mgnify:CR=1 FL=1
MVLEKGVRRLVVAGGETAGIPYAAWIAERLGLPMQYIRKKPKGFGRNAQIEGDIREGARTLLVEDLTTDGRSKINFCKALRDAGAVVGHVFVNFYYDIFPESKKILADLKERIVDATAGGGMGKADLLARGIYEALVTTAAGLSIAIPAVIAYYHFKSRIEDFSRGVEHLYGEIDPLLVPSEVPHASA